MYNPFPAGAEMAKAQSALRRHVAKTVLYLGLLGSLSFPCLANQLAACAPDFSSCHIPENVLVDLPFAAIAGDVIVLEPDLSAISDVFRIFNNLLDTGLGTGLGDQAFLFSSDDSTPLPDPSTFSANAIAIVEGAQGEGIFNGNGTTYVLSTPEPASWLLLSVAVVSLAWFARASLRPRRRESPTRAS
jgi:hypothetical protein